MKKSFYELSADLRMSRLWFGKETKHKKRRPVNVAINIKLLENHLLFDILFLPYAD